MISRKLLNLSRRSLGSTFMKRPAYPSSFRPSALSCQLFNTRNRCFSTGAPKPGPGGSQGGPRGEPGNAPDPLDNSPGYFSDEDSASFQSDRKFSNFVLFTGTFALIVIYLYSNVKKTVENKKQNVGKATYTGKADIGGPWVLYDTEGNAVTHKNFEGKYYLIYFGFTMCPDVCPISLSKVAKAKRIVQKSKEYKYFDLESIFVSLDPDRDTPERIQKYCKIFDENMVGLTHKANDDPELKKILKSFKIHSSKIFLTEVEEKEDEDAMKAVAPEVISTMQQAKPKKNDKYSLDHTIVTYLMGPDNNFVTYLGSNLNEKEMADIILDEISNDMGKRYRL